MRHRSAVPAHPGHRPPPQYTAAATLPRLLMLDLPAMEWTITAHGDLIGYGPAERIRQWAAHFDAPVHTGAGGFASAAWSVGRARVAVLTPPPAGGAW